jgi:hypothetical protein
MLLDVFGDERGQAAGVALAGFPRVTGGDERGAQRGGLCAFLRIEVAIAAAHGEAVGLTHGVDAMEHDVEIEIAHEAADDGELLIVFFAEDRRRRTE